MNVKTRDITIKNMSQIKQLTIEEIIKSAASHFDLDNLLPKYKK